MKKALIFIVIGLSFLSASCGRNVLPEEEVKKLSPQKILDMAAEKYSNYDYKDAVYYYSSIEKYFSADVSANDERAWAKYEIGYIRYQQNRYQEALKSFQEVLKIKVRSNAPVILAGKMIERIQKKK